MDMLTIKQLQAWHGKSHVLHGVDLRVGEGEIVSLLGRNGVGRSTLVKAVMGQVHASGDIRLRATPLLGLKAFQIAHLGVGSVPEGRTTTRQSSASRNRRPTVGGTCFEPSERSSTPMTSRPPSEVGGWSRSRSTTAGIPARSSIRTDSWSVACRP